MKHTRRLGLLLTLAAVCALATPGELYPWGATGHRITGKIAHDHLSQSARTRVAELIGSADLAQVTTWADEVRSATNWGFVASWHYSTVPDDRTVAEIVAENAATPMPDDILEAIQFLTAVLEGSAEETQAFSDALASEGASPLYQGPGGEDSVQGTALALLVHFIGDLHQPLHVGNGDDRGGNQVTVKWFGEETNLHSVWDTKMIESQGLSYTELSGFLEQQFASEAEGWSSGSVEDWALESKLLRQQEVYEWRPGRSNNLPDLSWRYQYLRFPTVKKRLYQAGIRMAFLLNSIFD